MPNGDAFDDAVRLALESPGLDVGCHLVLVGGWSVLDPGRGLPGSVAALLAAIAVGRIPIREELEAQVRKVLAAGIRPTHLDTHKHTHLLPPVLDALGRIAAEFAIPWVRAPFDVALKNVPSGTPVCARLASRSLRLLRPWFRRALACARPARAPEHGSLCRFPDHRTLRGRRSPRPVPAAPARGDRIHVSSWFLHGRASGRADATDGFARAGTGSAGGAGHAERAP